MPRPKGSRNKKTLERDAAERAKQEALLPAQPFDDAAARAHSLESEPTPLPAQRAVADYIEYTAPNAGHWRIENGKQLLIDFSMEFDEVSMWHGAIAPEKEVWHVLRMFYGIAPLIGESNPEYLRPHPVEEIGQPLGVDGAGITAKIESAKSFWMRWRVTNRSKIDLPVDTAPPVPQNEVDALMQKHGFADIDKSHHQYVAQRLNHFRHKLEDEEASSLPPQAIRLELQLINIDKIIDSLAATATGKENKDDREEMRTWMNMRDKVATQLIQVMEALDATQAQNPSTQRKLQNIDCLGIMVKAMQEYESRGDTTLIDGINTASDIKFLISPTSLRPAQYRPDVVALLNDALKHTNLWDPNYVMPSLDRGTHRRLLKSFQESVRIATEEDGGIPDMEDEESAAPVQELGGSTTGQGEGSIAEPIGRAAAAVGAATSRPSSRKRAGDDFA